MREHYIQQLNEIQNDLIRMGIQVEQALDSSMKALSSWNIDAAKVLIAGDSAIDAAQAELNNRVLNLITRQQPLATDLRILLAILAIASELERMGDYAKGIGKRVLRAVKTPKLIDVPTDIYLMARHDQSMIRSCLDAFVNQDIVEAQKLRGADDIVDDLEDRVTKQLIDVMRLDGDTVDCAAELLSVVHNLERLADRTTNIAEKVIFIVTSRVEELNS